MNLFILTQSDGSPIADKTLAAVTSVTDSTVLEDLGNLVLGDSEPLIVKFTTGTAAPSFAGDSTYTLAVSLGAVSADGSMNYSSTSSFSTVTGGWSGRLALNTQMLIAAVQALAGGIWQPANGNPKGGWLALQIRVTNPSGQATTFALLRVYIEWRVVAANLEDTGSAEFLLGAVHPRPDITSLEGGGVTSLDGIDDTNLPTGYTALLSYSYVGQTWQIFAGTWATDAADGKVRVKNYSASNQRVWRLL